MPHADAREIVRNFRKKELAAGASLAYIEGVTQHREWIEAMDRIESRVHAYRNDGGVMRSCCATAERIGDGAGGVLISVQDVPFRDNPRIRPMLRLKVVDLRRLLEIAEGR